MAFISRPQPSRRRKRWCAFCGQRLQKRGLGSGIDAAYFLSAFAKRNYKNSQISVHNRLNRQPLRWYNWIGIVGFVCRNGGFYGKTDRTQNHCSLLKTFAWGQASRWKQLDFKSKVAFGELRQTARLHQLEMVHRRRFLRCEFCWGKITIPFLQRVLSYLFLMYVR